MKKFLYLLLVLSTVIFSCEEDDNIVYESNRLAIKFENTNGSDLKIIWNKPPLENIVRYVLVKTTIEKSSDFYDEILNYFLEGGYYYGNTINGAEVFSYYPHNTSEHTESLGLSPNYYYKMFAYTYEGKFLFSNLLTYNQVGCVSLDFRPEDAIYSSSQDKIVFKSFNNKVYIYDCKQEEIVAEKNFNTTLGKISIEKTGSGEEIYVPQYSGVLSILDFDLNTNASVNIGVNINCVTSDKNNLIFVYGSNYSNNSIYAIDRSNAEIINISSSYSSNYHNRIACMTISNSLIEVSSNTLYRYTYNNQGYLTFAESRNLSCDITIMDIFPDGSGLIVDDTGYIIGGTFYTIYVTYDSNYNDFTATEHKIYGIKYYEKSINSFGKQGSYYKQKSTRVYPELVCGDNEILYVIGTDDTNARNNYYIEKISPVF